MPKLTQDDIALFEGQLRRLHDAALGLVRQQLHQAPDSTDLALPNHFAEVREQAQADLLADTELAQLEIELANLAAIEAALGRIGDGTFGCCEQCGGRIALRRLRAQPMARRCLACQEALEKHRLPSAG